MKRVISVLAVAFSLCGRRASAAAEEPVLRVEPLVQEAIARNPKILAAREKTLRPERKNPPGRRP